MGIRFRKSINLGKGFRINLSKSGLGYSWGTKGLRFTKTAKGTVRTTLGIPGTGLSYSTESGGKKRDKKEEREQERPIGEEQEQQEPRDRKPEKEGKGSSGVLLKVICWILTVFFGVLAATNIPETVGFVALAAAALLLPVDRWQDLVSRFIPGWLKVVVIVVLAVMTFVMGPFAGLKDMLPSFPETETVEQTERAGQTTDADASEKKEYILNTSSKKFHTPDCSSAVDMKEENKKVCTDTREALIGQGYEPCSRCDP